LDLTIEEANYELADFINEKNLDARVVERVPFKSKKALLP